MSNPFVTADRYNEMRLDVHAFAEALAPHLGGTVLPAREDFDRAWSAGISLPSGISLHLSRAHGSGKLGHCEVRCSPTGLELNANEWPRHIKFPSATVNTGRPLEAVAKDITRRVAEPAQEPAAELRSKAQAVDNARVQMRAAVAAFKAKHPTVRVTMDSDERSASLSSGPNGGAYFTGRLASDGSVYFERVGSIGGACLAKVLEALTVA